MHNDEYDPDTTTTCTQSHKEEAEERCYEEWKRSEVSKEALENY